MKSTLILLLTTFITASSASAQVPAIPEPGLVLYGKILAANGTTTVPATSVNLTIRKQGGASTAVSAEVINSDELWYYVAQIPFESVLPGLDDSSVPNFVEAQNTDDTYGLDPNPSASTAVYEGGTDPVAAVDGGGSSSTFSFGNSARRGDVVRMDIMTDFNVSNLPNYDDWAAGFFGGATGNGAKTSNPDGDGMTNEQEWLFNTDPTNTNPEKKLHRVVVNIVPIAGNPNQKRIEFFPKWNDGRIYNITKTLDLGSSEPWVTPIPGIAITDGSQIGNTGAVEASGTDTSAIEPEAQYRIEVRLTP